MLKEEIKNKLIAYQEGLVEDFAKAVEEQHVGADIDEEDTRDPEDFSHQDEAGDLMLRLKQKLQVAEQDLNALKEIPLDSKDRIVQGALVETDKWFFYVGLATQSMEHDGKTLAGISTQAPI